MFFTLTADTIKHCETKVANSAGLENCLEKHMGFKELSKIHKS